MNSARLKNAFLVVLAVAIPIAYYAGGTSGFGKGYGAALFSQSADAGRTVFMLRKLRSGDSGAAIGMMESELDSLVILNDKSRESFRSSFNLPRLMKVGSTATIDKLASPAVAYRAEFPSSAPPSLKASIDGALAQLAKHSNERD
jgi:hypothetical protein